ncbi:hypothetical protein BGX38DRAFT_1164285 [Terfezia claveryi]|nr:hypothetical protein BGX38DRAFT_1164285 [Terfezia claveryi]
MTEVPVSHGRGGTGNIGPDDTQYVDGGIHREGDPATQGVPYSTGRGGASNIASPKAEVVKTGSDDDIIPEVTKVTTKEGPYHGGRGGEGNVVGPNPKKSHKGLAERIKERVIGFLNSNRKKKAGKTPVEAPKEEAKKGEPVPTSETTVVAPAAEVKEAAEAEAPKPEEVKA